ncbi:formylglycine-generating enzyme family protein [Gordonia sinesedis]
MATHALGRADAAHPIESRPVPAGTFAMGDAFDEGYRTDGEIPVHHVTLDAFAIDATAVTNDAFAAFVDATGYVTDAERFGSSAVFAALAGPVADARPVAATPWWLEVPGARWDRPFGPGSDLTDRGDHPVVHVSHADALAYCAWAGRALPTESQWEYAARGGLDGARFPWGDDEPTGDQPRCNIFPGEFPDRPSGDVGTIPARALVPNGFGLYQTVGNVWEWCADRFDARAYRGAAPVNPAGPDRGRSRVLRGGSYLCHDSYCRRYRVAARSHNTPETSTGNIGFRTVAPGAGNAAR